MATVEEVGVGNEQKDGRRGFLGFGEFSFINLGTGYTRMLTLQKYTELYNYDLCTFPYP